jgi:hypothetical protein
MYRFRRIVPVSGPCQAAGNRLQGENDAQCKAIRGSPWKYQESSGCSQKKAHYRAFAEGDSDSTRKASHQSEKRSTGFVI